MLRKDIQLKAAKNRREVKGPPTQSQDLSLWDALRAKRREIADAQDVPPYIIFHDATLMAMLEARPTTLRQMAKLSGIGERKLSQYGEQFLAIIREYTGLGAGAETIITETINTTLEMFQLGYSIEQIVRKRMLKETTIYNHLAQGIEQGRVAMRSVIELPDAEIKQIEDVLLNLPEDQKNSLKPVYEQFDGAYGFDVLRCIRAALQNRTA
jgi:ATP-dependent DNA helicase RecQ